MTLSAVGMTAALGPFGGGATYFERKIDPHPHAWHVWLRVGGSRSRLAGLGTPAPRPAVPDPTPAARTSRSVRSCTAGRSAPPTSRCSSPAGRTPPIACATSRCSSRAPAHMCLPTALGQGSSGYKLRRPSGPAARVPRRRNGEAGQDRRRARPGTHRGFSLCAEVHDCSQSDGRGRCLWPAPRW